MRGLIFIIVTIFCVIYAQAFNYFGLQYRPINNTECAVVGFAQPHSASVNLIIPNIAGDSIKTYEVTHIDSEAFSGCVEIDELLLGTNIKYIGDNAFSSCINIKEVIIPTSVKKIGREAFARCISLNRAIINAETIGVNAFGDCFNLVLAQINPGVKYIEPGAFHDCTILPYIDIPFTVEYLGSSLNMKGVFEDCLSLQSVTFTYNLSDKLPNLKTIGRYTFKNCISLQRLDLPYSVTYIMADAFLRCADLKHLEWGGPSTLKVAQVDLAGVPLSRIVFHGDVELERPYNFEKLENLAEVRFDKYATKVQSGLFANISSLKEVHLDNISKIGYRAFENCNKLSELTLPESLLDIENGAFQGCSALKDVTLPSALTQINDNVFNNCSSLKNIKLGDNISRIGQNSFKGCTSLESIVFPMSVKLFASSCLDGCTALKSLTIGGSDQIEYMYLAKESPIENLFLRGNVKSSLAWPSLKKVTISDYCTEICSYNFYGCTELTDINFNQISNIGSRAFYGCSSLTSVNLTNVSVIGAYAFNNCTALAEIKFGPELTELSSCIDNTGIRSLIIPDNVTSFTTPNNCQKLTNVNIGSGVSYVGSFEKCPAISELWYGESVENISPPETKNLIKITSANSTPPSIAYFYKETYETAQLVVPVGALEAYRTTNPWRNFKNITEANLNSVETVTSDDTGLILKVRGNILNIECEYQIVIFHADGRIIKSLDPGEHEIMLSKGLYVISCGTSAQKVVIP